MLINTLKRIMAVTLAVAAAAAVHAEKVWHLVADGLEKVPVGDIECIISKPASGTMDIVLKDNAGVLPDVASASLSLCERSGIVEAAAVEATVLGPWNGIITVTGLPENAQVTVCNSQGIAMASFTSRGADEPVLVDVSGYASGIYFLHTPTTTVKFLKQ